MQSIYRVPMDLHKLYVLESSRHNLTFYYCNVNLQAKNQFSKNAKYIGKAFSHFHKFFITHYEWY